MANNIFKSITGSAGADLGLQAATGQNLVLRNTSATAIFYISSAGLPVFSGTPIPSSSNTYDVGSSTYKFRNLFLSGDVTVDGGDVTSAATTFNLLNATVTTLNLGGAVTTMNVGAALCDFKVAGRIRATTVTTFTANDTTPSVAAGNVFIVPATWTAGNNITAFDDGGAGQVITIIGGDSDCVVTDGSALKIAGNWTAAADATLTLAFNGTSWYEIARSAN
jgi:hypothetical protein